MPPPSFSEIDVPGISTVSLAYREAKSFLLRRDGNEMHMIRHETVGPDFHITISTPLGHQAQIDPVVFIAEKSLLTAISALNDVVG